MEPAQATPIKKKRFEPIQIRVIEYTIENLNNQTAEIRYRLITSLLDSQKLPANLLAAEYNPIRFT